LENKIDNIDIKSEDCINTIEEKLNITIDEDEILEHANTFYLEEKLNDFELPVLTFDYDMVLPDKIDEVNIVYESLNTDIVNFEGNKIILNKEFYQQNATIRIILQKEFDGIVYSVYKDINISISKITDEQYINNIVDNFNFNNIIPNFEGFDNSYIIESDLNYIYNIDEVSITYNDNSIVDESGNFKNPTINLYDILKINFIFNDVEITKEIKIYSIGSSDIDKIEKTYNDLDFDVIKGNNIDIDKIQNNLNLVKDDSSFSKQDCVIQWVSDNENLISNDGIVSVSESGEVNLTATITLNNETRTKTFTFNVVPDEISYVNNIADNFNLNAEDLLNIKNEIILPNIIEDNVNVSYNVSDSNFIIENNTLKPILLPYLKKDTDNTTLTITFEYNGIETQRQIEIKPSVKPTIKIPLLVILVNYDDYKITDEFSGDYISFYENQVFDVDNKSIVNYFDNQSNGSIVFEKAIDNPILEVSLDYNHPQDDNIYNSLSEAITLTDNEIDYSKFDTNSDGVIDNTELSVLYIVAGGEGSTGDDLSHSVWGHSYGFDSGIENNSDNVPVLDNVRVLDIRNGGKYSVIGNIQFFDKSYYRNSTLGIKVHEIGHANFNFVDLYSTNGNGYNGVGYYSLMSMGSWGSTNNDDNLGDTPTDITPFSKNQIADQYFKDHIYNEFYNENNLDITFNNNIYVNIDSNTDIDIEINCNSNKDIIKIQDSNQYEPFYVECRLYNDDVLNYSNGIIKPSNDTEFDNNVNVLLYRTNLQQSDNNDNTNYLFGILEKTGNEFEEEQNYTGKFNDGYVVGDVINDISFSDDSPANFEISILEKTDSNNIILNIKGK